MLGISVLSTSCLIVCWLCCSFEMDSCSGSVTSKRFFWSGTGSSEELEQLVNLIVQRLLLADKVAISKWDSRQPIEDLPREEIILQGVVQQAQNSGLDANWAQLFFRDQIEANKDVQRGLHQLWGGQGHRPNGPGVNLATEVRPRIDAINASLLTLSKATEQLRSQRACKRASGDVARNLAFHRYKLDKLHQESLWRAIANICPAGIRRTSLQ